MAGRDLFAQQTQPAQQQAPAQQQGRNLFSQQLPQATTDQHAERGFFDPVELPEFKPLIGGMSLDKQRAIAAGLNSSKLGAGLAKLAGLGRKTTESVTARELIDAPISDIGAKLAFNVAMNFDDQEIEQVIINEFGEQALSKDSAGNTYATIDGEKFIINRPGLSKADVGKNLANVMTFLGPAKLASFGRGVMARVGLGAAASGAMQTGIEAAQAATGGEFDTADVVGATVFGGLGEVPAAIISSRGLTEGAKTLLPDTSPQALKAAEQAAEQGISLSPAQASDDQFLTLVETALSRDKDQAARFANAMRKGNEQTLTAVQQFLDDLAPQEAVALAARDVRDTASNLVAGAKASRSAETSPIYRKVYNFANENKIMIDTGEIVSALDDVIENNAGSIAKEATKIKNDLIRLSQPNKSGTNARKLANLKQSLNDQVTELKAFGKYNETIARAVQDTWSSVRNKLREGVPGYAAADDKFALISNLPAGVTELTDATPIGNIANVSDDQLKRVSSTLFNWKDNIANETSLRRAKELIGNANPNAWNALVRQRLESQMFKVADDAVSTGRIRNIPSQLYRSLYSGRDKSMNLMAMSKEQQRNFNALMQAVDRASFRPAASQTAQLAQIEQSLRGNNGVGGFISTLLRRDAEEIGRRVINENARVARNTKILADIYTNPRWFDDLERIRKLGMATPEGGAAFLQLFRTAMSEDEG